MAFEAFQKIPRLRRDCIVTEKIDGTNGQILITEDHQLWIGSRNQWISTPSNRFNTDPFGFAKLPRDGKMYKSLFVLLSLCCTKGRLIFRGLIDVWQVYEKMGAERLQGSCAPRGWWCFTRLQTIYLNKPSRKTMSRKASRRPHDLDAHGCREGHMEEMKGLADLGWFCNNPLDELAKIEQEIIERLKASSEWSSTPIARPTDEGENQ